jgi:hypothetical protein
MKNYNFKDFKPVWKKLKLDLRTIHLELFYDCVDIDGTVGRRIYTGCGREDNPIFYTHWFAVGRCHWNVILPCFMLNNNSFIGDYKILTNDKHSVIIHHDTLYCPTSNNEGIISRFFEKDDYEILELRDFIPSVLINLDKLPLFLEKYKHYQMEIKK